LPRGIEKALFYLKPISDVSHDSRFLDVGCGERSEWLETLSRCGFASLKGVDPYLSNAGKRNGVSYQSVQLDAVQGEFDVITFHHSLEHISNQHVTLENVRRLLAKGGTCIVRIPLVDSLAWERYGVRWVELDAPRHLYLHSQASLTRLAAETGLKVVNILHDSTSFEFAGSEQYLLDIPLTAPNSIWNSRQSIFSEEQLRGYSELASQANRDKRGGRAAFYLKHARA
jgi:SAM-dependent methyltransferase